MRKSNYDKAVEMAYEYGDKRVKRFADTLRKTFAEGMYGYDEIINHIESTLLVDALRSMTEQQLDTPPNSLKDNDV